MRTYTNQNQPFGILRAYRIRLWITEWCNINIICLYSKNFVDITKPAIYNRAEKVQNPTDWMSSGVRCQINRGFPRHLNVWCLPSGISAKFTSTFAKANTSADGLIVDTNFVTKFLATYAAPTPETGNARETDYSLRSYSTVGIFKLKAHPKIEVSLK